MIIFFLLANPEYREAVLSIKPFIMKKILFSFVALLTATLLFSQPAINISGTVTDNSGAPLNLVDVIVVDSSSIGVQFAVTQTDAQGIYNVPLQAVPSSNIIAGVVDCNGNSILQPVQFNAMNSNGTANFIIPCAAAPGGGGNWPGGQQCLAQWFSMPDSANSMSFFPVAFDPFLTYAWSFGDGATSNQMTPQHTYSVNGVYSVCLTVSDAATGCSDTFCDSVLVPGVITGGGGTGGNPGGGNGGTWGPGMGLCDAFFLPLGDTSNTVQFLPFNIDASLNYSWDFGDGNSSTQILPTHTYAAQGAYSVCLIVSDPAGGCADTACISVDVPQLTGPWGPGTGTGGPWGPGGGPGSGGNWGACDAFFLPLTDSSLTADFFPAVVDSSMIYAWDFGDGNTSSAVNPQHTFATAGAYIVCLNVTGQSAAGPCSASFCQAVVVPFDTALCGPWMPGYGFPGQGGGPIIGLPGGGGNSGCSALFMPFPDTIPLAVHFVRLPLDTNLTYAWDFGDGNVSVDPLPLHIYSASGTYPVCLTVTDPANGCTDTFCDTVSVQTATWSGGSFAPSVGILESATLGELSAYPNPTSSSITVSLTETLGGETGLRIIDMTGRLVWQQNEFAFEGQNKWEVDLSGLAAGSYLLQVTQNGAADYLRIMKQ